MPSCAYSAGFQDAIEGSYTCPHSSWSLDFWSWHAGNFAGHQYLCASLEFIHGHFQQD